VLVAGSSELAVGLGARVSDIVIKPIAVSSNFASRALAFVPGFSTIESTGAL
jgi:hypothetical protein